MFPKLWQMQGAPQWGTPIFPRGNRWAVKCDLLEEGDMCRSGWRTRRAREMSARCAVRDHWFIVRLALVLPSAEQQSDLVPDNGA